ncbi:MAG: hypothetical protein AAGE65_03490 [Planctomycetota bacterium]
MNIVMTRTVTTKDGARWPSGARLTTTAEELAEREVPDDAYRLQDEKPGDVRTSDVSGPDRPGPKPKPKRKSTTPK